MLQHEWLISGNVDTPSTSTWIVMLPQLTNTRQVYLFSVLLQALFSQKRMHDHMTLSSPSVNTFTRVEASPVWRSHADS